MTAESSSSSPQSLPTSRNSVFICYSHKDQKWLEKLLIQLKPLERQHRLVPWNDKKIPTGADWLQAIQRALAEAAAAIFLVSPDFLASDFISEVELPELLKRAQQEGLRVCWILVRPSRYDTSGLDRFQAAHDVSRPLSTLTPPRQEATLVEITRKIEALVNLQLGQPVPESPEGSGKTEYPAQPLPRPQVKKLTHEIPPEGLVQPSPPVTTPLDQTGKSSENMLNEIPETPRMSLADLAKNPAIINLLVGILSEQACLAPVNMGARGYLREKIMQATWPETWKYTRIGGLTNDAESDSRDLIYYAIRQGKLPHYDNLTALGSLLLTFQDDLGGDDLYKIQTILQDYHLTD